MASTLALIVYSARNNVVRRVTIPTDDSEFQNIKGFFLPGEAAVVVPQQAFVAAAQANAQSASPTNLPVEVTVIAQALNISAANIPSGRCAVIDLQGNVINVISADPVIDQMPGVTLVETDIADIGWTFVGGVFVAPVVVVVTPPPVVTPPS